MIRDIAKLQVSLHARLNSHYEIYGTRNDIKKDEKDIGKLIIESSKKIGVVEGKHSLGREFLSIL